MDESLSSAVIDAVAEIENVRPVDLPEPLFEAIDPDALDCLFTGGSGTVTFDYFGYRVTVDSKANILVDG